MGYESVPSMVDQNCIPTYLGVYIILQVLLFAQLRMEAGEYCNGLHCTANALCLCPLCIFTPSRSEPIRAI